jgi:methionyl-tRNA formyltransferase
MQKTPNIIFAGTPDFAVPTLTALIKSGYNVVAVYTQPDKPSGRGRKLQMPPVKEQALTYNIPVEQPLNFKDDLSLAKMQSYNPDILVVAAYGLLLPQKVLDIPRVTSLNVHASLLPRWRGASPINHAILAGDATTGVSIMQIALALDAGPVYTTVAYEIAPNDDAITLTAKLATIGAKALVDVIANITTQDITPTPQIAKDATYAPKLNKEHARLDFNSSAASLSLQTKAMQPWPGACFSYNDNIIKVLELAAITDNNYANYADGEIIRWDKAGLVIKAQDNPVRITKMQLAGGKVLSASQMWCGNNNLFQVGNKALV